MQITVVITSGYIKFQQIEKFVVPPSGGLSYRVNDLISKEPPEGGTTNFSANFILYLIKTTLHIRKILIL